MNEENSVDRYEKYRDNLRRVLSEIKPEKRENSGCLMEVLDLAKRYYDDAEHFSKNGDIETALISLAYSEGLIDGLRIMGHVKFRWTGER